MKGLERGLVGGAVVVAGVSGVLGGRYLSQSPRPPMPAPTLGVVPAAGPVSASQSAAAAASPTPAMGAVTGLAPSTPVSLTVPAIGLHSSPVQPLGLDA